MSCLIIKNDGIGDLILSSGLIASVGRHFDGNVDLVTCVANQEIAEGIEPLRNRYFVSRDKIDFYIERKKSWAYPLQRTRKTVFIPYFTDEEDRLTLQVLAAQQYDVVISLRRFIRKSTLVIMQHARGDKKYCTWQFPTNAAYGEAEQLSRGWSHYSGPQTELSELSYFKLFLEDALRTTIDCQPQLNFCHKQPGIPGSRKIALGLGGSIATWSCGYWIELGKRLSSSGWKLLLLGGDDVAEMGKIFESKVPGTENHIGQLSWQKTEEVLSTCDGYIGNDTGLSHFASLIIERCMIILGGGTFRRFFPWPKTGNQHVIFHGLNCYDCSWRCKYHDRFCLSLVQPEEVERYFTKMMNQNAEPECDLNDRNEIYLLAWRREKDFGSAYVRGD